VSYGLAVVGQPDVTLRRRGRASSDATEKDSDVRWRAQSTSQQADTARRLIALAASTAAAQHCCKTELQLMLFHLSFCLLAATDAVGRLTKPRMLTASVKSDANVASYVNNLHRSMFYLLDWIGAAGVLGRLHGLQHALLRN